MHAHCSHLPRKFTALALTLPLLMMIGCVPQDRYDQLLTAHRSLEEQLNKAEAERDSERANIETMRARLSHASQKLAEIESEKGRLDRDLERMGGDYASLLRRVAELEIGPLPEETERAIQDLAAAHPNLLTFDSRRGLLRFASDFTFDLGSASLTSEATRTLGELAKILNTSAAGNFEVRVIGHTDNVRIGRPETARHHPTNTHLSVHRAISVRDALMNSGVRPERMQVAGYGPYRPLVPNRQGGTAENRRVEIFLVPMPHGFDPVQEQATLGTVTPAPPRSRDADDPLK